MQEPPDDASREHCASCGVSLTSRAAFRLKRRTAVVLKCAKCALVDARLLGRSARVSAIVGTALVALNQGDQLLAGTFPWDTSWYKIPLTYTVPFLVATYGALANGYRGSSGQAD